VSAAPAETSVHEAPIETPSEDDQHDHCNDVSAAPAEASVHEAPIETPSASGNE
jgi:hypothetical protein